MTAPAARELARHARAFGLRWLARLSSRRIGVVLVLHGVAADRGDARTDVVPRIGRAMLDATARHLRRHYRVVHATAVQEHAAARRRGARIPVALTFDDDLASHAELAGPLLEGVGLRATFFLGGTSLDAPQRPWWDDLQTALDRGLLSAEHLPELAADVVAPALERRERGPAGLAAAIERLPAESRAAVAARLRSLAGPPGPGDGLRRDAVRGLVRSGFEIGFHTVRHEPLPTVDDDGLDAAFQEGRRALEDAVGARLTAVAYPHGRADARVAAAARHAGFEHGFTGEAGVVTQLSDPLLLPRVGPALASPGAFAVQLARLASGRTRRQEG